MVFQSYNVNIIATVAMPKEDDQNDLIIHIPQKYRSIFLIFPTVYDIYLLYF